MDYICGFRSYEHVLYVKNVLFMQHNLETFLVKSHNSHKSNLKHIHN